MRRSGPIVAPATAVGRGERRPGPRATPGTTGNRNGRLGV